MEALVYDGNFSPVSILDVFESFIWTDRFYEAGDFEIYTSANDPIAASIAQDYYIRLANEDRGMVVESIGIESNAETGDKIKITGRSLESILDRRIIWKQTNLDGNLQNGVKKLLNENLISPSASSRRIPNFVFKTSTDPYITGLTIQAQYTGDNLYDVISAICKEAEIGFKVTFNTSNQFVFELYSGVDRSFDQTDNSYVIFSPRFENIINANFFKSKMTLKNVTLVAGEDILNEDKEPIGRRTREVGSASGLNRRELYTDAHDISSKDEDDNTIPDSEYNAMLDQRGKEDLAENKATETFEGQVDTSQLFIYGRDFNMGDIVQMEDNLGNRSKARITEFIRSHDDQGYSAYPSFEVIQEE